MHQVSRTDPFHGIFLAGGERLERHPAGATTMTDPETGRTLRIATVELGGAICPACDRRAQGGFISFVEDLRLVFACPCCQTLSWVPA